MKNEELDPTWTFDDKAKPTCSICNKPAADENWCETCWDYHHQKCVEEFLWHSGISESDA